MFWNTFWGRKMAKFWVSLIKFAGIEVDADTPGEAQDIATSTPEEEYEYDQFQGSEWSVMSIEPLDDTP